MRKIKSKPTGKSWGPDDGFDWSPYEDGCDGGSSLYVNKSVKVSGNDKVFCHEAYAQELYDIISGHHNGANMHPSAKDAKSGVVYTINDIRALSDHEVLIDSDSGMSSVVDLNKETQFVKNLGYHNSRDFVDALSDVDYRKRLLGDGVLAKVMDKNRVSIWEGYKSKIEKEFMDELLRKDGPHFGYKGTVVCTSGGGYTVDVLGVQCFMPASLASSGPITDAESLIGQEIHVCVVNYSVPTKNFVVSHKKYIEITLPSRIYEELYVGKPVFVKVTGTSKNGIFCAIKDNEGKWLYTSLMHRTTMSKCMEEMFDEGQFNVGDEFRAYVHKLNWIDDKNCRIVIGDSQPVLEDEKENLVDVEK